jgi:hypothetical protein
MPGQLGFKYVYATKHINDVLLKIQDSGRPDKLTFAYMRDIWLFKDAKYSAVLDLLKDMDFVDDSGMPTELYAEYQNSGLSKKALAKGIKKAYPELFKAYHNANSLQKEIVTGYFKQRTGAEKAVLEKIVSTFTTLCTLADFSLDTESSNNINPSENKHDLEPKQNAPSATLVPISMNIQIVIPSDASSDQYDKIFASIKKFLTPSA